MVADGWRLCVPGNHDMKLLRKLTGRHVQSYARVGADSWSNWRRRRRRHSAKEVAEFLDGLVSHYVLDDGKLVVAHAGMKEEMQGRGSGKVREFALYGETTGETDEFGLPVRTTGRRNTVAGRRVVYGHTPVPEPEWLNRTDQHRHRLRLRRQAHRGLRYPEKEFVSVPAARTYCEPARPFLPEDAPASHGPAGPRRSSRCRRCAGQADRLDPAPGHVTIREGNATAALEVDEPVRRQPEVADLPAAHDVAVRDQQRRLGFLEHPARRSRTSGARASPTVICEEKHMGSRAWS